MKNHEQESPVAFEISVERHTITKTKCFDPKNNYSYPSFTAAQYGLLAYLWRQKAILNAMIEKQCDVFDRIMQEMPSASEHCKEVAAKINEKTLQKLTTIAVSIQDIQALRVSSFDEPEKTKKNGAKKTAEVIAEVQEHAEVTADVTPDEASKALVAKMQSENEKLKALLAKSAPKKVVKKAAKSKKSK